jgi:hypothetical protein
VKRIIRRLWIRALQLWIDLCEVRLVIVDHAIQTAVSPKAAEKLSNDRDRILISSHAAQFRLMRSTRKQGEI